MGFFEFQVRKKSSQISQLEEQLDEKSIEFSNCVSRVKQLEHDVTFRDEEITRIQAELKEKQQALQQLRTSTDKNQQLHQEQCKDYEKQIEMVNIFYIDVMLSFCLCFKFTTYEKNLG